MPYSEYESPFTSRYSSREMSALFSQQHRGTLFRRLWLALAASEQKLGLNITDRQLDQMRAHLEEIDFNKVFEYEKQFRHDVMAHIHVFGDQCPEAKPIIHLGATSTYVTDNADLIQLKAALLLLIQKITVAIRSLSSFAKKHAGTPCLGLTHYQSAQPTTVGKRACLWLQDLLTDALEWERLHRELPFLGAKGATGTQASFLALFNGDEQKVKKLETLIAHEFGFETIVPICGQTYPRKIDLLVVNALSAFAAGVHKMATDLRLLAHDGEISEARLESQIGSSAMPYKRNPIFAERLCGLSRFIISLSQNPTYTLAVQWLERSLDDSANRRLSLPEAFLAADAILNILIPLIEGLQVDEKTVQRRLNENLSHLIMENILMEAVQRGGNRQELHERLRKISQVEQIAADPAFRMNEKEIRAFSDIKSLIGCAPSQVHEFLKGPVDSFLKRHTQQTVIIPPLEI